VDQFYSLKLIAQKRDRFATKDLLANLFLVFNKRHHLNIRVS
jgi:hypothetical protein